MDYRERDATGADLHGLGRAPWRVHSGHAFGVACLSWLLGCSGGREVDTVRGPGLGRSQGQPSGKDADVAQNPADPVVDAATRASPPLVCPREALPSAADGGVQDAPITTPDTVCSEDEIGFSDFESSAAPNDLEQLAQGVGLRLEAVSKGGGLVAYSSAAKSGAAARDLWLWDAHSGDAILIGEGLTGFGLRFQGNTLLAWEGTLPGLVSDDFKSQLLAWRPGDSRLETLACAIDPQAIRFSPDERWISVEVNDQDSDDKPTADIVLIDSAQLTLTSVAALDHARARFSHDSSLLLYAGQTEECGTRIWRRDLKDGATSDVACLQIPQKSARWELSADDEWLVHYNFSGTADEARALELSPLQRTSLLTAETQNLADLVYYRRRGKEFDVAKGGERIAFIGTAPDSKSMLQVLDAPGQMPTRIATAGRIIEHYADVIVFEGDLAPICGTDTWWSASPLGDALELISPSSPSAAMALPCEAPRPRILDHDAGALLVRGADEKLRWAPKPPAAPIVLGCGEAGGEFISDRQLLISAGLPGSASLALFDTAAQTLSLLHAEISGPFDAEGGYYFTTLQGPGADRLVRGRLP